MTQHSGDKLDSRVKKLEELLWIFRFEESAFIVAETVPDGVIVKDATMAVGSAHLHSATAGFTPKSVGKLYVVTGAGPADQFGAVWLDHLFGTIVAYVSPTEVVLDQTASRNVTNVSAAYGTDNAPMLQRAVRLGAATGKPVIVPAGNMMMGENVILNGLSNLTVFQYGAVYISSQDPSISFSSVFITGPTSTTSIPLHADVPVGATTIEIDGTVAIGDQVTMFTPSLTGGIYTVRNVSGAAPQTVTLDRPTFFPFPFLTSTFEVLTGASQNLAFHGGTFTGTCNSVFEMLNVYGLKMVDVAFTDEVGSAWRCHGYDDFCFDVLVENERITGPMLASVEGNEHIRFPVFKQIGAGSTIAGTSGLGFSRCANFSLEDFEVSSLAGGVAVIGVESVRGSVSNGVIERCGNGNPGGLTLTGVDMLATAVTSRFNAAAGMASANGSTNHTYVGCDCRGNGSTDYGMGASNVGIRWYGCSSDQSESPTTGGASGWALLDGASLIDCDLIGTSANANPGVTCLGGSIMIRGLQCDVSAQANSSSIQTNGSTLLVVEDCTLKSGSNASGVNHGSGVAVVRDTTFLGGRGIASATGTTVRLEGRVDADATSNPFTFLGGFCNRSIGAAAPNNPITGTGAVAWPDLKLADRVVYARRTLGGTGVEPTTAYTPATGFTATYVAGDTSTWDYVVGPG